MNGVTGGVVAIISPSEPLVQAAMDNDLEAASLLLAYGAYEEPESREP
ncbi:MAG: hypothetical protein QOH49_1703 [Acidobacteriota bacterium]|nr:hypothetical protein [Acidobacteriota bacterium]